MDEIETGKQQKTIVEGAEKMLIYKTDGGNKQNWRLNAKIYYWIDVSRNSSEKKKKKKVEDYILSQRNLLDTYIDIDDKMEDQKSNGTNNNQDFELKKEDDNNNNDNVGRKTILKKTLVIINRSRCGKYFVYYKCSFIYLETYHIRYKWFYVYVSYAW